MRILDLFSGIGGFSLGLHRASETFQTVAFCEMDPFCTQILNKHWPDVPVYPDIRKLNGKEIGAIDIVCGGFPCQPFSQAGKRRGKDDDRDLWPEMFRIIQECQPTWVVGENVAGFVNMELDRTVSDLESEGYEVRTFVLGAVAVQAPHQRQRCWIIGRKRDVANSGGTRTGGTLGTISDQGRGTGEGRAESIRQGHGEASTNRTATTSQDVADCKSARLQTRGGNRVGTDHGSRRNEGQSPGACGETGDVADSERKCRRTGEKPRQSAGGTARESTRNSSQDVADRNDTGLQRGVQDRESYPEGRQESGNGSTAERGTGRQGNRNGPGSTQRGMGDLADGLSARLLDIGSIWHIEPDIPRVTTGEKNRIKKLKALGNSVVPQIPEIIGRLIMEAEREIQSEGIHQDQE